jgi:aryl carrier-like protein
MNEEELTPEGYLNLTNEQKRDIVKVTPKIKPLGTTGLDEINFVGLSIKWKTPRYYVRFNEL